MIIPTIHLNGTSRDSLVENLCNASNTLEDAYRALKSTAPNGRDYYPQGPEAIETAMSEHMNRLERLDEIKQEIDTLTVRISDSI